VALGRDIWVVLTGSEGYVSLWGEEVLKLDRNKTAGQRNGRSVEAAKHIDRVVRHLSGSTEMAPVLPFLKERISLKIPSDIAILDRVLEYLNERLLRLGIAGPDDTEILIALDEAIVNAIKHGNKSDPTKKVRIVAEMSAKGARFTISDEGSGFARDCVPDPTDPLRLLMPSGRGLLLINHIMDHVTHNECGNKITMVCRSRGSKTKS
jgi:serine/threonine-protein kinase RsbW